MGAARQLLEKLRHGHADTSKRIAVAADHVRRDGVAQAAPITADGQIVSGRDYVSVSVEGMRLDADRVFTKTYDPMVLAITEFLYDGKVRSVPFVVGAPMIKGADAGVPAGMGFEHTTVAAPHPYYGQLAVTVILYRVLREDYLRLVLGALQKASAALDLATGLSAYLKVGEAVLDGVETVLGQGDSQPLLGHRLQLDGPSITAGTHIVTSHELDPAQVHLRNGELMTGLPSGDAQPLQGESYLAYTIAPATPPELSTLQWFDPLWKRIMQWANIPNDSAKETAKQYLAALYEEIATSPDVARNSADDLYAGYERRAREIHQTARERAAWSLEQVREDPARARALEIRAEEW